MRVQSTPEHTHVSTPASPALDVLKHALFLDFDGTLVDIADRPHAVIVSDALRTLLAALHTVTALALISGRTIADIQSLLGDQFAHIAGVHGHEMKYGGEIRRDEARHSPIPFAAAEIRALQRNDRMPALVEDKGASLALHYRHAPRAEQEVRRIARDIATRRGLRVLEGKMVIELISGPHTKGDALMNFMRTPPFAGRTPIMIGDDITDEHGFRAARAAGGFGILVGAARKTEAAYRLDDPAAVHAWLQAGLAQ
ncbi:trehalose-phosphatase [Vitreimonas flagellata]|uniref:trehalose-phosphatase n=1 Tax=Vitreimonas flagellata TaxID=2560861 RepID=UPI00142FEDD1|nr:trehalose-phosphatase [Vitreimonas flagellata]